MSSKNCFNFFNLSFVCFSFVLRGGTLGFSAAEAASVAESKTYKIGIVQVIDEGEKLQNYRQCNQQNDNKAFNYPVPTSNLSSGYGRTLTRHVNLPCQMYYPNKNKNFLETNLDKIVHAEGAFKLSNIDHKHINRKSRKEDLMIYPLTTLGRFWESLLEKENITNTVLGPNPKFSVELLPMIEKKNTMKANKTPPDQADRVMVKSFFQEVLDENKIDLAPYDFVVYIQYQIKENKHPNLDQFKRSFAGASLQGKKSTFIAFKMDDFVGNKGFMTIAHELGHVMFGLHDSYDGLKGKFPAGAYDWNTSNWPSKKACLMTEYFPKELSSKNGEQFLAWIPAADINLADNIPLYLREDPSNYYLCAEDKEIIMNPDSIYAKNLFEPVVAPVGVKLDPNVKNQVIYVNEGDEVQLEAYYKYIDPRIKTTQKLNVDAIMLNYNPLQALGIDADRAWDKKNSKYNAMPDFIPFDETLNVPAGATSILLQNKLKILNDSLNERDELFRVGRTFFLIRGK